MGISALVLLGATSLPSVAQSGASFGLYVYPSQGQNQTQQANDESVCYKSAVSKTGIDPTNLQPAPAPKVTPRQGGAVRGAARGAAAGALFGAITGNAGGGAAVGAAAGGVHGYASQRRYNEAEQHYAVASTQEQHSQQMSNFRRAYGACLESKGYTVK
jgi:predicted lipid-binding transport protein (Tim44 family)